MKVTVATSLLVAALACQSAQAALFDLSSRITPQRSTDAKAFGATLDNTVWTADCGKGSFKFAFTSKGGIGLNDAWDSFTWVVTDVRTVALTGTDGGRAYFVFDNEIKTLQFISWQYEPCTGKKT